MRGHLPRARGPMTLVPVAPNAPAPRSAHTSLALNSARTPATNGRSTHGSCSTTSPRSTASGTRCAPWPRPGSPTTSARPHRQDLCAELQVAGELRPQLWRAPADGALPARRRLALHFETLPTFIWRDGERVPEGLPRGDATRHNVLSACSSFYDFLLQDQGPAEGRVRLQPVRSRPLPGHRPPVHPYTRPHRGGDPQAAARRAR